MTLSFSFSSLPSCRSLLSQCSCGVCFCCFVIFILFVCWHGHFHLFGNPIVRCHGVFIVFQVGFLCFGIVAEPLACFHSSCNMSQSVRLSGMFPCSSYQFEAFFRLSASFVLLHVLLCRFDPDCASASHCAGILLFEVGEFNESNFQA